MALTEIIQILNNLGGKASIREITSIGKQKKLNETVTSNLKVRDSLVRLSKKGIVKEELSSEDFYDRKWVVIKQPTENN